MVSAENESQSGLRRRSVALKVTAAVAGVVAAAIAGYLTFSQSSATARDPLGRHAPSTQLISMDAIDHSPCDTLLRKYVDHDGYVDYSAWRQSDADRRALQEYLASLSRASTTLPATRNAQLAFWINAYNAVTVEGILQVYPTDSIRNHTSYVGGYNIWKDLPLIVGDGEFSLHEMEHEILRPMIEPRIHFAIVCAAVGCPPLRNEAYTAERLEAQLVDNAREFFSRPQALRVEGRTLYLSSILNWYGGDFGESQQQQLTALRPYLPEHARELADDPGTRVRYLDYDWTLNDQALKTVAAPISDPPFNPEPAFPPSAAVTSAKVTFSSRQLP